jgi:hypothetical protein
VSLVVGCHQGLAHQGATGFIAPMFLIIGVEWRIFGKILPIESGFRSRP